MIQKVNFISKITSFKLYPRLQQLKRGDEIIESFSPQFIGKEREKERLKKGVRGGIEIDRWKDTTVEQLNC